MTSFGAGQLGKPPCSFETAKSQLLSSQVLAHYDPNLELVVACDASAYGVGAVLSHRLPDRTEKPIGFAW